MSAATLFYQETQETLQRILTRGFADHESYCLSNSPACSHQARMRSRLMHTRPTENDDLPPLELLKVTLDLTVDELCRDYELVPCRGKAERTFRIPGHILNAHAEIVPTTPGSEGEESWDQYPGLEFSRDAGTQFAIGMNIALVGDPELDLEGVPQLLQACGFNVRSAGVVGDGDAVLFCISCADGPQESTRTSIASCSGLRIRPLGILLTQFVLVDDESLHELVKCELRDLLTRIIPVETVDLLPALISGDPCLADKIQDILSAGRDDNRRRP